jgi:hypothetical protein
MMNTYVVTLRHSGGRIRIKTCASSADAALRIVLSYECAPMSSVIDVRMEN